MASIALRRTKDLRVNGRPVVALPAKYVHVRNIKLTSEDQLMYDRLENEASSIISGLIEDSTLLQNYMSVLEIILRLRQVCNSSSLCPEGRLGDIVKAAASMCGPAGSGAALSAEQLQVLLEHLRKVADEECPICLSPMELPCITRCSHFFCRRCIESVCVRDKPSCPMCRQPIAVAQLIDLPAESSSQEANPAAGPAAAGSSTQAEVGKRSAKVSTLLQHLKENQLKSAQQPNQPPIKSVVFSQFTGMLNLVQAALMEEAIPFRRLDGSTPARMRAEALQEFARPSRDSPVVFLVSLKAGGVGLNLTAASECHLLDPWWNASVEEQAMDRVHRLGQPRDVHVYRYIAQGTIEERMLDLQEAKRELCKAAFAGRRKPDEVKDARINDVRLLMRL
mmetsp:Transcript_33193/g.73381  ORF Transcript_33193/g.73381 Transcript_33193/m.73381 type:complete len:394 (+) Transcript_33193:661-1842(+)